MSHMGVFYDKEIKQIKQIFADEAQPIVESICQLYTAYQSLDEELDNLDELIRTLAEELKNVRDQVNYGSVVHNLGNLNKSN